MDTTRTSIRVTAMTLAAVIVVSLFSTIVGHMPPDFAGAPSEAHAAPDARTAVAIVPARIEVIGLRSSDTAANNADLARPRS